MQMALAAKKTIMLAALLLTLPTLAAGVARTDRVSGIGSDGRGYSSAGYACPPQDSATIIATQITAAFLSRGDSVAIAIRTSLGFSATGPISVTAETDSSVCRGARLKLDSVLHTINGDTLRPVYIDRVDTLLVLHDAFSPRYTARSFAVVLARGNFRYVGRWR